MGAPPGTWKRPAGARIHQKETPLHIASATFLRHALPPPCRFLHVPNEDDGMLSKEQRSKRIAMGMWPGAADLLIMMPKARGGWIELKTKTGPQQDNQIEFERAAQLLGWPYEICRSVEEVAATAERWIAPLGLKLRARIT